MDYNQTLCGFYLGFPKPGFSQVLLLSHALVPFQGSSARDFIFLDRFAACHDDWTCCIAIVYRYRQDTRC